MEIEFQNRWISQFDHVKSVPGMPVGVGLDECTADSDAGRLKTLEGMVKGTVLKVESRPCTAEQMKGTAQKDLRAMCNMSRMIAKVSGSR